jgi:hypothetical protein
MTRPRIPKNTADALLQQAYAARNRAVAKELAASDPTAARWALLEAADMEKYAAAYLEIAPGSIKVGTGGEMVSTTARRTVADKQLTGSQSRVRGMGDRTEGGRTV